MVNKIQNIQSNYLIVYLWGHGVCPTYGISIKFEIQ